MADCRAHDVAVPINAEPVPEAPSRRAEARDRLMLTLVVVQTCLLMVLTLGGAYAYAQFTDRAQQLESVTTILNDPTEVLNNPAVSKALARTLQEASSAFFLGSTNGSLVSFVQDLAQTDFSSVANELRPFTARAAAAFVEKSSSPECRELVMCSDYGSVQCPDGKWVWCNGPGTTVNCASCPYDEATQIATAADSVVARLQTLQRTPQSATVQPAALSDGVFRLNSILSWVGRQGDSAAWAAAARSAIDLTAAAQAVNWSGNYTRGDGSTGGWNANPTVAQVSQYVLDYANVFASLQQAPHAKAAGHAKSAKAGPAKAAGHKKP